MTERNCIIKLENWLKYNNCIAVYCNRSCLLVCGCVGVFCGSVTTIVEIACIDPHQTRIVGKGSDHLQLIKFWPSRAPGKGGLLRGEIFGCALLSQRTVFASPPSAFFIHLCNICCAVRINIDYELMCPSYSYWFGNMRESAVRMTYHQQRRSTIWQIGS